MFSDNRKRMIEQDNDNEQTEEFIGVPMTPSIRNDDNITNQAITNEQVEETQNVSDKKQKREQKTYIQREENKKQKVAVVREYIKDKFKSTTDRVFNLVNLILDSANVPKAEFKM